MTSNGCSASICLCLVRLLVRLRADEQRMLAQTRCCSCNNATLTTTHAAVIIGIIARIVSQTTLFLHHDVTLSLTSSTPYYSMVSWSCFVWPCATWFCKNVRGRIRPELFKALYSFHVRSIISDCTGICSFEGTEWVLYSVVIRQQSWRVCIELSVRWSSAFIEASIFIWSFDLGGKVSTGGR